MDVITNPTVVPVIPRTTTIALTSQGLQGIQGPLGPPGSTPYLDLITISTNGQTVFNLSRSPITPSLSTLYLNGVKEVYGIDYLINLAVLTWLRSSLILQTSDTFELYYQ